MELTHRDAVAACRHQYTRDDEPTCFSAPLDGPAGENPSAHGNICIVETCSDCGAQRPRNVNGWHVEYGDWAAKVRP